MPEPKLHLTEVEVTCPLCEAEPNEPCIGTRDGWFHMERSDVASLHEIVETRVPDSDVIAQHCVECEWEDAR